jgi:hypothetical protein
MGVKLGSVKLGEEGRVKVFEEKVLRRIFD